MKEFVLKYSTSGGSNIFKLFDTSEKKDHLVANRRRWLEHPRGRAATQERWPNELHDFEYQGAVAKAPCPEMKVLLERHCRSKARRSQRRPRVNNGRQEKAKRCLAERGKGNLRKC